jgi:hypothetical protein
MTRIWQTFRTVRGTAATLSALLALFIGVIELRSLVSASAGSMPATWQAQAASAAIAAATLGGATFAMRKGNLAILLVGWAFVLGAMFTNAIQIVSELAGARGQSNAVLAVLSVNFEVAATVLGVGFALLAAVPRKKSSRSGNSLSIGG